MDLQRTVVELYQDKKIEKAAAYRLLAELKKGLTAVVAAPEEPRLKCSLECSSHGLASEIAALTTWVYFVHVVSGLSEVALDCVMRDRTVTIRVPVHGQLTARQLGQSIAAERHGGRAAGTPAPFAWLTKGAVDRTPRQLAATYLAAENGDAAALEPAFELEVRAALDPSRATRPSDWPDMLAQFHRVLWEAPDTPMAALDRLPERHHKLLADYNNTTMYLPPARTLPGLLGPALALEDDAVAVQTSAGELGYRAYKRHAHRVAHLLRRLGVQRNERVAVVIRRTVMMPPTLYGIVCAGAAYVPLEPDMPADRMQTIVRNTGARIVVTDAETLYAEQLPFGEWNLSHLVCIDGWPRPQHQGLPVFDAGAIEQCDDRAPAVVNEPDDLCYVIYTSGSTGTPKGVMISHLGLINTLIGVNNVFSVGPEDKVLCFSSYGFDLSVWDMFGAALAGGCVFVPTKPEIRDPAALLGIVRDAGITIWNSVPTGMNRLLAPLAGCEVEPIPTLRLALLGGEFIQPGLPPELHRVFPNCRLANMGGATEGSVWSIYHYPVERYEPHWKSIPYGRPLPNQRFYVLNELLKPCAVGEMGMLYIGGLGVAQGYLNDDERTAAAFRSAPWPGEPGGRIYCTGDLGFMRSEGVIELCGRADHQVKVRGFRVELGEIESQLSRIEGIEHVAVVAKQDAAKQYRLIAFYVSSGGEIAAETLRSKLAERLPEYMLPSQFVFLQDPPIGATGKLDRKALENREVSRDQMGQNYVKPTNEVEAQLAADLARILRLDQVGLDDDFFLIGGDSLNALQYIAALAQLGFSANPLDIEEGRSIRGVLGRVTAERQATAEEENALVPLTPMGRKFLERLPLVDRDHWNQLLMIGFDHRPDFDRLHRALQGVIDHHPLLRAVYEPGGLRVAPQAHFDLPVVDLSAVPFFRRGAALQEHAARLHATVGLTRPQLSNALLVHMGPRDTRLLWVLHHLIVDANCWRVLIDDLAARYRQPDARLLRSEGVADYVAMVRAGAAQARETLGALPRYPRMPVPGVKTPSWHAIRPDTGREGDGRTLRLILRPAETARILDLVRQGAVPNLNLLLLTALALALRAWAGQERVRFDIISNGRSVDPSRDFSRAIGWFATHNPFETAVPDSVDAALAQVATAWRRYQENSRFFVEVCNDVRGNARHPLGRHVDQALLYSFLGDFDSVGLPQGWSILGSAGRNRGAANPRTHELEMEAMVARGCLMLRLVCGKKLMERRVARGLLSHVRAALARMTRELAGQRRASTQTALVPQELG